MENEPKKISFGFSKLSKKSNIIIHKEPLTKNETKVQLIEYLEGQSIKVVGGNEETTKAPLVIPMKQPNKKLINLIEIVKNDFQEVVDEGDDISKNENNSINDVNHLNSELSLEEQAAKELLNDLHKKETKEESKRVIGVDTGEKVTFEGEKESTIDDYESIPIDEFGKALLRGMGWKDGQGIGKNQKLVKMTQPTIRPKGMGLGADKMAKQDSKAKPAVDRDGKALTCVKRAFVKIIAGYHKGYYGQIIGLDDESGRFIIKTALNNLNLSLNEFLVTPVTKEEYMKNSKVINNAKYEEFIKKKELEKEIEEKAALEIEKDCKDYRDKKEQRELENKYDDSSNRSEKYDKRKVKKEIDSDDEKSRRRSDHSRIKKEEKSDVSDIDEERNRKEKFKKPIKKERHSSESENNESNKNYKRHEEKYTEKNVKYDFKREESRERRNRDKDRERKSKHYSSDESDSEKDDKNHKRSSSKYSTNDSETSSKKKHKKKKSKRYSSDESSDERYKRKSKKSDSKKYDDSDLEHDKKHHSSRSHKKDKKKDKRERSKHDK